MAELPALKENFSGHYTKADDLMWSALYQKQTENLRDKAHSGFLTNLKAFNLSTARVPSLTEVSEKLMAATGWQAKGVPGLVGYEKYFTMLKQKQFPVANFIRGKNETDLSKDPDIFHEVYGHCSMLLSADYADFMAEYARFALTIAEHDKPMFARLIWFTTETGLIREDNAIKIYGSSILSSYKEANFCLTDASVIKKEFCVSDMFREPYRADILQKVYYVISDVTQIYNLLANTTELFAALALARELGEFTPLFPITNDKYSNIGHCHKLESISA